MNRGHIDTPVAIFVFNRPRKTRQVIAQIAEVEPERLLVVADGPRSGCPADNEKCERTRSLIEEAINWECDFRRNYAEENLGLQERFTTGLDWVFSICREAIILEDDCVPTRSFFHFCEQLLDRYRGDERVMDISGTNYLSEWKPDSQDYHFSLYGGIWGWATWRESWEWYDPNMELWEDPEVRSRIRDLIADDSQFGYLKYIYQRVYDGDIETWDYQWGFAKHRNSALSIVPSRNLVSNIGFDETATNTNDSGSGWEEIPSYEITFPLRDKDAIGVDREYDRRFHRMRPISQRNPLLRRGRLIYEELLS